MLKETFAALARNYTDDRYLINKVWNEIEQKYTGEGRYYHTLAHLDGLLKLLHGVQREMRDWNVVLFTLYYHDVIYSSVSNKNEEESAAFAEKRMKLAGIPNQSIERLKNKFWRPKGTF